MTPDDLMTPDRPHDLHLDPETGRCGLPGCQIGECVMNALTSASPVAEGRAREAGPVLPPVTVPGRSTSRDRLGARVWGDETREWVKLGAVVSAEARTEIARIIASERAAAEIGAPTKAAAATRANRVEAAWRHLYPGLAALHDNSGHALLSLVLPVGLLGGLLVLLAGPARLVESIPVTPTPNGFVLLVMAGVIGYGWWRMRRVPSADEPLAGEPRRQLQVVPELKTHEGPWFGTAPAVQRGPVSDYVLSEEAWAEGHYPEDVEQW